MLAANMLQREKENDRKLPADRLEPYKTELRLEVLARRRELTRVHLLRREATADKKSHKAGLGGNNVVTIDTNKARSNSDVVRLAIRDLGWREFPFHRRDHNCDITWHSSSFFDQPEIYSGQVNKFPGSVEIFRKANTFRWLEFMKTLFPEQYDFFPRTWLLPHQFGEFANTVRSASERKSKQRTMYIVKPSDGSQGQGIYLLDDPYGYNNCNSRGHVVQEYLSNVFLIDRYKFDLRVYVVLRSLEPLEFHICKEGLARFSTMRYEKPSNKNMHETFMHLTNYSLNKRSNDFKISDKEDEGSKRKLSAVFKMLNKMGHDMSIVWSKIEHLVVKTLIAVAGELKVEHQAAIPPGKPGPTCFQVLGFDIILLKNLQPMLLEVNSNPSLTITEEHESDSGCVDYVVSSKDEEVKRALIRDTLTLVAPKHKFTRRRKRHRHKRPNKSKEENMDTDKLDQGKHKHVHRREGGVSLRHVDNETEPPQSMFGQMDRSKSLLESRVVSDGHGEVSSNEDMASNCSSSDSSAQEPISRMRSLKIWINKKMTESHDTVGTSDSHGRLPDVFVRSENSSDVVMKDDEGEDQTDEEESDGREPGELPDDNYQIESSGDDVDDVDNNGYDDRGDDGEKDDEFEESCLKEIFPASYGDSYKSHRIMEKLADIFILSLGVKGCLRLSPSMFRLFARKCHLSRKGITNADIDVLYLDMQRKWDYMNPDRTPGLNFFAFVSGCCKMANDDFTGNSPAAQIQNFIEHCQAFMKIPTELDLEAAKRVRKYGQGFGRSKEKEFLKLPLADERRRPRSLDLRPVLAERSLNDLNFPLLNHRHRQVFDMLQRVKK